MDRWIAATEYDALFECLFDRRLGARPQGETDESKARKAPLSTSDARQAPDKAS
jgi:hypothetical protein